MKFEVLQQKLERMCKLRGYSDKTVKTYLSQLKLFEKWLKKDLDSVIVEDVNRYKLHLMKKGWKNSSIRSAVESIKFGLGQVLGKKRFLKLRGPKLNKPLKPFFTRDEVKKMLTSIRNIKHRLLFMFLYGSGPRVEECVRVKISDVYVSGKECFIYSGKGNKDRSTIVGDEFVRAMKLYLKERKDNNPYLFNRGDGHITSRTAQEIINSAKRRCSIKKLGNCHALRRSFATHLADDGINIKTLQKMLGHASVKTTIGYIQAGEDLSKIKSPLDNL